MNPDVRRYLSRIGRSGGRKSRRTLTPEAARNMVMVREARRAFRDYHALCFWSFDPDRPIKAADIPWVVEQLRRHGNRETWDVADRLCR